MPVFLVAVAGLFAGMVAGSGAVAVAVAGVGMVAVAIAFADAGLGMGAVGGTGRGMGAVAIVGAVAGTGALALAATRADVFALAVAILGAVTVAIMVASFTAALSKRAGRDAFLVGFVTTAVIICLISTSLLAPLASWDPAGPMLLFFGLLTLVNAPFDWASLGLTRALLRRGLERGGWWPLWYALIDAAAAAVIIAALTVAMVVFVQAFDDLAALAAGDTRKNPAARPAVCRHRRAPRRA